MKTRIISTLIVLLTVFNFVGCDSEPIDPAITIPSGGDPDPTDPDPSNPGTFTVDFDGQTYTALTTVVYITNGSLMLNAVRANGDSFGFLVEGATVGSYPANDNLLAFNPAGEEYSFWSANPDDDSEDTGEFVITSVNTTNHTVSGTFHFKGYWSNDEETVEPKEFTNGVFTNLPYVVQSPTGDQFTATFDGDDFDAEQVLAVSTSVGSVDVISIAGAIGEESITVTFPETASPGQTFVVVPTAATSESAQVVYMTAEGQSSTAVSGSVTITSITDDQVEGTFNAVIEDTNGNHQITGGHFSAAY